MKFRRVLPIIALATTAVSAYADTAASPFSWLVDGYTQELYATFPGTLTSFAFAPDGGVWAVLGSPNTLVRFDAHATVLQHGSPVHPVIASVPVNGVSGLANHVNGNLYGVAAGHVQVFDANTGSLLSQSSSCSAYQAASNPIAPGHLAAAGPGILFDIDPVSLTCYDTNVIFWQAQVVEDAAFDPATDQLVLAVLNYGCSGGCLPPPPILFELWVSSPDYKTPGPRTEFPANPVGVAVLDGMRHVIAQLDDGSLMQADLTSNAPGVVTPFASGGFAWGSTYFGGIARKAPDGCLMVLQPGTRYADGTQTSDYSLVRICSDQIRTQASTWGRLKGAYR